jgi:hypothetical protein
VLLLLLLLLRAPVNVEEAVARRPLLRMSPHNQRQILRKCGEQQSFPKQAGGGSAPVAQFQLHATAEQNSRGREVDGKGDLASEVRAASCAATSAVCAR